MLDPDGDPLTDDSPDIVNNSWAFANTVDQCVQEFQADLALLRESEITVVFSGGNFGAAPDTSVSPANDTSVLAVGSVDVDMNIANSSSRGAGACDGGIYPQIVAPGVSVQTLAPVPTYINVLSGTSFAAPHISGGMALLKGAFPDATVSQLESAVLVSATDLGAAGADNDFGYGLLDLVGAYDWLTANVGGEGSLQLESATYSLDESVAILDITVTRTGGSTGSVTVDYATSDGTATAGEDYTATSGTLTFLDGEITQTISIPLLDDTVFEGDEDFSVSLSVVTGGATLGTPDIGAITIVDDELSGPPEAVADTIYLTTMDGVDFVGQRCVGE